MGDAFWIKEARGVIFQKTTSSVGVYSEDHCKYCFDIFGMNICHFDMNERPEEN